MGLRIEFDGRARKHLGSLPRHDAERVEQRLAAYAEEPDGRQHDVVAIRGSDARLRLRVGDWRVVFERHADYILIVEVGHRREIYR